MLSSRCKITSKQMKKVFSLICIATLILTGISSCKKAVNETVKYNYNCVQGKVLRENCEGGVIQILTPDLNIGDSTWEDRQGSLVNPLAAVYNNVVNAANICSIRENFVAKNIMVGDTIYFSADPIEDIYFDNECIVCHGFESDLPGKKIKMYNISKLRCNELR